MKKIYLGMVLITVIGIAWGRVAFAESNGRWWDEKEIPDLNLIKDLKLGRIGMNYYVDGTNGDDKGDGSPMSPWKTIGKAFDYYAGRPGPGDAIIIKAGVYRERISIRCKGSYTNRILVGPYGDGEVIIDASERVDGWSLYKDKIYKAQCVFKPTAVVIDEKPLFPEFSLEKVTEGKWYYDDKDKVIYIYIKDSNNPSSHDIGVISDDEYQNGLFLDHTEYVTIYGLTIKYASGHGISILGDYNTIEKCNIKFNGKAAVAIWPYYDTKSIGNAVIKSHIYHNMIRNWPRGRYKWGLWAAGAGGGVTDLQLIGNVVHKNGGEGLLVGGERALIRDNIVYDNWSVNIYVLGSDSIVERNLIFCHEPNPTDLYNNGDDNPRDNKNFRRLRAEGIMTADEEPPAIFRNAKIINNIIIGCRRSITHYGKAKGSGLKDVLIANNTIILPDAEGVGEEFIGINIPYNYGNNNNIKVYNNIIYGVHPKTHLLNLDTGLSVLNKDFHGVSFANNLWYQRINLKPFRAGPKWMDIYSSRGLRPRSDSLAIDAGIAVKEVTGDYYNNPRKDNPDIGAIESIKNE